jgi:tRNA U38,U39,U40 pseudouridine synthase TruA
MQRYKIVLQYFGTKYIGWQRQKEEASSKKHSVQWHFEVLYFHF